MAAHPFLSDPWIDEARSLRARWEGRIQPPDVPVRLNVIVTDIPHRDDDLDGHIDSSAGQTIMERGHVEDAHLTVTVDYETAKAAFVTRDQQAVMQAFLMGRIFVDGDASQLLAMMAAQAGAADDADLAELYQEMRAFTVDD